MCCLSMKWLSVAVVLVVVGALNVDVAKGASAGGGKKKPVNICPPDSVQVGSPCVGKYEASVWETVDASLIDKIKDGTVTLADLTSAGAIQRGVSSDDYGLGCPDTGHGCKDVYAVSIPGVTPSRFITWFQAAAAARNSGTRLPTNAEWQVAALGTPDTVLPGPGPADCNTFSFGGPDLTGNRTNCFSDVGAFDMVGNVAEWVTNWGPVAGIMNLPNFSDDYFNCAGVQAVQALVRGGNFNAGANGRDAGPFSSECVAVMTGSGLVGFRIFR